jgi:hypothetical protein
MQKARDSEKARDREHDCVCLFEGTKGRWERERMLSSENMNVYVYIYIYTHICVCIYIKYIKFIKYIYTYKTNALW